MKVLVTGAGGKTGGLVVKRLLARGQGQFEVVAAVRSEQSKPTLEALGLPGSHIHVVDITQGITPELQQAVAGCHALVIVTSAVPEMLPQTEPGPPKFAWKAGQAPEQVDWHGQKAQIDAAMAAGVRHIVLVSSMGGTNPNHFLNTIAGGNILNWKRKAEQYLMAKAAESNGAINYTIIHPSGLLDEAGSQRQLQLGVDDSLTSNTNRTVPREDVAELCVQSLLLPQALNRSIDVSSLPAGSTLGTIDRYGACTMAAGEGSPTQDFTSLWESLNGANCNYDINSCYP